MKKIFSLFLTAALLSGCSSSSAPAQQGIFVMDTYLSVAEYDGISAADSVFLLAREMEKKLSVTDPDSEISRINQADGEPCAVSDDTAELIGQTLAVCERTNGALDPTLYPVTAEWGFTTGEYRIPDDERLLELLELVDYRTVRLEGTTVALPSGAKLDLGASAKGFALKKMAELMKSKGTQAAVLNLGGNIQTIGTKPDGALWRAAIAAPQEPSENLCVLEVGECSIATSGNYERYFIGEDGMRYCHILDPQTGRPVSGEPSSVTVVGEDAAVCDALSTALFVMGTQRAAEFWRENGDFEMVIVEESGKILLTEGLEDCFRLSKAYPDAQTEVLRR